VKTDNRLGSVAALMKGRPRGIRDIAGALRRLVAACHPGSVETPRMGEGCTTYGIGARKMTEAYACILPCAGHVTLGLYRGAALDDPSGLLEGAGKSMRHVKVRDLRGAASPALRALLVASIAERRAAARAAA
jgi:hypothetical protein